MGLHKKGTTRRDDYKERKLQGERTIRRQNNIKRRLYTEKPTEYIRKTIYPGSYIKIVLHGKVR